MAAYVSVGREPGTAVLLDALVAAGKRVIVPVVLPDLDLDWAAYDGPDSLAPARRGLLEPAAPRLGVDAVATADVVLVPGMAVSPPATGSARAAAATTGRWPGCRSARPSCVLLYDGEVGLDVPVEPHDRPVTAAVTPTGGLLPLR